MQMRKFFPKMICAKRIYIFFREPTTKKQLNRNREKMKSLFTSGIFFHMAHAFAFDPVGIGLSMQTNRFFANNVAGFDFSLLNLHGIFAFLDNRARFEISGCFVCSSNLSKVWLEFFLISRSNFLQGMDHHTCTGRRGKCNSSMKFFVFKHTSLSNMTSSKIRKV